MILASNGRFYEQHKVLTQLFAQYIELSYCISFTALLHIWNMLFSMVNDMRPLTALLSLSLFVGSIKTPVFYCSLLVLAASINTLDSSSTNTNYAPPRTA